MQKSIKQLLNIICIIEIKYIINNWNNSIYKFNNIETMQY